MTAASNYLENKVLDHVLTTTTYTAPGARYLGLFKNVSTNAMANLESGVLTDEVSGGSYARTLITFGAAVNGSASNNAQITFPVATVDWGTVTHLAILDASTAGNVLFYGPAITSKLIQTGDTFIVFVGNLIVTLS